MPLPMIKEKGIGQTVHPLDSIGAVIAIAAGKGGVGKSSVTVNLALALQRQGYRVGIMDTDIYGPSIRQMLPEEVHPTQQGQLIQPAICKGIKMISMAYFRKKDEATAVRAPIANGLISQFIQNVQWGDLDYLLIDFPPGTGDIQLTLSQQAHLAGALLVTTPQEVALMDVRKAASLFDIVQIPILGIIENMSYYRSEQSQAPQFIFGKEGGKKLAEKVGVPLLGQIPLDPYICRSGDQGSSIFEGEEKEGAAAKVFLEISQHVVAQVNLVKKERIEGIAPFELTWKEMERS